MHYISTAQSFASAPKLREFVMHLKKGIDFFGKVVYNIIIKDMHTQTQSAPRGKPLLRGAAFILKGG